MDKRLWIVGQVENENNQGIIWNFQGVYDTEQKALDSCKGHPEYFIGPAMLNEELPPESCVWKGAYYPSREVQK